MRSVWAVLAPLAVLGLLGATVGVSFHGHSFVGGFFGTIWAFIQAALYVAGGALVGAGAGWVINRSDGVGPGAAIGGFSVLILAGAYF